MTSEKYYMIFVQWDKGDRWTPEFGDYDREVVKQELEDSYKGEVHKSKIMTLDSCFQGSVDKALEQLNK